jgi:hypothetical protein
MSIDQSGTIQAAFADGLLLGIMQIAGCASENSADCLYPMIHGQPPVDS